MPNPGRMSELLLPEATLYLEDHGRPASLKGSNEKLKKRRKTRFTVWAVERDGAPVFLHTHQTNQVARSLLQAGRIPELEAARIVRAEVPHGRSRFDFLIEERGARSFLEVKSVTLFGNGAALFPDAVTARGRNHLLKLGQLGDEAIEKGLPKPVVLFLVHSDRVDRFLPDYHTDFDFARAFLEIRGRVRLLPVSVGWTPSLQLKDTVKSLTIPWEFLNREVQDSGAYLILVKIDEKRRIRVGKLGSLSFPPGWYVYVGSAAKGLTQRMARHLRKKKRFHWHIDYLRQHGAKTLALPIRSSSDQECAIVDSLSQVLSPHSPGFGCSDCTCRTHLFYRSDHPLHDRHFQKVLERFRMPAISFSDFPIPHET